MSVSVQAVLSLYASGRTADYVLDSCDGVRERMEQIMFEAIIVPAMYVSIQAMSTLRVRADGC